MVELLEEAVGDTTTYCVLEPFRCTVMNGGSPSVLGIQNAGKIIAQHAGLGHLTFVITVSQQRPNCAGHIELEHGSRDVHIEVSPDLCQYSDAVLATLCHEITHKFLHVKSLQNGRTQIEQEFLTDVAAVYLGFGKIMLNGCECVSESVYSTGGRTTRTTHTLNTGYISRECFAFVYRLVCEMRKIPRSTYLSGLSDAALGSLFSCEKRYGQFFDSSCHDLSATENLARELHQVIRELQDRAAHHEVILRQTSNLLSTMDQLVAASHSPLRVAQTSVAALAKEQPNPHLRYLDRVATRERVYESTSKWISQFDKDRSVWASLERIATLALSSCAEKYMTIDCPIDRGRLRLPANKKQLLVTCPLCQDCFVVTNTLEISDSAESECKRKPMARLRRLLNTFARVRS